MSKYKRISIHLVESIEEATIKNDFFKVTEWCEEDVNVLIKCGEFIKNQLKEYEKKIQKNKKRQINKYERFEKQPEYLKKWVEGISEKINYHVFLEGKELAIIKKDGGTTYLNRSSGSQYFCTEYTLINKKEALEKGMWHHKGKVVHEGRITKNKIEELKELI